MPMVDEALASIESPPAWSAKRYFDPRPLMLPEPDTSWLTSGEP